MTFYEELGVPPDASPDTIREAYRNVAKVLHPDAQTNPALKESAEVQMKRVNHLYEVLSDPEQRRRYDLELAAPPRRQNRVIIHTPRAFEPPAVRRNGTLTWLAATAICGTFILWLGTRESAGPISYSRMGEEPAGATAASSVGKPERLRDVEIARLRIALAAAYAERDRLAKQVATLQGDRRFQPPATAAVPPDRPQPAVLSPAPLTAAEAPVDLGIPVLHPVSPPAPTVPKSRWAGSWTYHPRAESRKGTLFPPEFIETVIAEANGNLRGQYHARFKVADARISPDVDFRFEGRVAGTSGRFAWTGAGGAKGDVQIRLVTESTIEVVWTATDLGTSMGLASGTAVLNRKN
jgi:hypothetical protein